MKNTNNSLSQAKTRVLIRAVDEESSAPLFYAILLVDVWGYPYYFLTNDTIACDTTFKGILVIINILVIPDIFKYPLFLKTI